MTSKRQTVLLVEDNDLNLKLFRDLLLIKEYKVITSKTGLGIPELVKKQYPDLILMDIQLGSISGIDVIKELRSISAFDHIPIIAITAFAMKSDEAQISASGCDMYLPKPVAIDLFFQTLDKFLKPN